MKHANIKICIVVGTRPEIIKMSPVIRECQRRQLRFFIVHTNQHYSANLDKIFFSELKLPRPKYNLHANGGTPAEGSAAMLIGLEKILKKEKPTVVLVEGDTNTVLAGALAASRLNIKIGHVEAGLRSYFNEMPEERNRILTDHCSDFLFTPTQGAKNILKKEGMPLDSIFVVGNTIVDAVHQNLPLSKHKGTFKKTYFLATFHRAENVDNKKRLSGILAGLEAVSKEYNMRILCPLHPRTKDRIRTFSLPLPKGVEFIDPVGYLEFLWLESHAELVLTDSGGIQEEACILRVPCVTLRDNTERPETLAVGSNILAGATAKKIVSSTKKMLQIKKNWHNPFGDGKTAARIIDILTKEL